MKRILLLSFLTFFAGGNSFAQSKPAETFRKFWKLARSSKVKSASKFFANVQTSDKENNDKQIGESFQVISRNKLKFPELNDSQIFPESAYFNFQIETKDKKKFKGQVLLLNQNKEWKILLFNVSPVFEIKSSPSVKSFPPPKLPVKTFPGIPRGKERSIGG